MPRFFGQADGIIFKQAVRLELCGVALTAHGEMIVINKKFQRCISAMTAETARSRSRVVFVITFVVRCVDRLKKGETSRVSLMFFYL